MNDLFGNTKLAAYFLWEYTGCENAFDLWLCAEDMACLFEQSGLIEPCGVEGIVSSGMYGLEYIEFVRTISYRIFQYTNRDDEWQNWFAAERLLNNGEWVDALTRISAIYRYEKNNQEVMNEVRSENVRAFYGEQTLLKP